MNETRFVAILEFTYISVEWISQAIIHQQPIKELRVAAVKRITLFIGLSISRREVCGILKTKNIYLEALYFFEIVYASREQRAVLDNVVLSDLSLLTQKMLAIVALFALLTAYLFLFREYTIILYGISLVLWNRKK